MTTKLFPLTVLLFLFWHSNAQSQPLQLTLSAHRGFIWKQSDGTAHLITHHPQGFSIAIGKKTSGQKAWHQLYNFPKIGWSLKSFITYHNSLGNIWSLSPYIDLVIWHNPKNRIGLKSELGLGYCTKPFRPETNNKNLMLGTSLNYLIQFGFDYERILSDHFSFHWGGDVIHFSNANFRLPNKSLTIFYTQSGFSYRLNEPNGQNNNELLAEPVSMGWSVNVGGSIGFNGAHPFDRNTYPSYHLISYLSNRWNPKSSFNFGMDYFHNLGIKKAIALDWNLRGKPLPDFRKVGLTIGHEQWFGKTVAMAQLGVYVYQPYAAPSLFYSRIGLKYHINDFAFGFMTVKFHKGQSEVAEWGLGFRLHKKG